MVTLNARCRDILTLLLQSQTPLASAEIAQQLGVTPRQVRYSLRDIETWLEKRDVHLIKRPGCGILIDAPDRLKSELVRELEHLSDHPLSLSPCERCHILVLSLLVNDQPLLVKQLEPRLGVSRSTVLKDMDKAERWLEERNLSLIRRPHFGFKAIGPETDWREAVVGFLLDTVGEMPLLALYAGSKTALRSRLKREADLLRCLSAFLEGLELCDSKTLVDSMRETLHLQFTDNAYVSLVLHLAILIGRVRQGKAIELAPEHLESLREQREFFTAKLIAEQIDSSLGTALTESEVAYIAMQLLGAKIQRTVPDIVGEGEADRIDPEMAEIAEGILAEASVFLHPYLRGDRQLIRSLAFHLQPVLSRLRFNLPIRNPLLGDVKRQYPYIFEVARRSSGILEERAGRRIPEEEIGYIAMHLGASMERLRPPSRTRRRVVVVCSKGVATAWLAVSRIQAEFPEIEVVEVMPTSEVSSKHTFRGDIDMMISTVPIEIAGIPIIVVSPLLSARDKARIRESLRIGIPALKPVGVAGEEKEPSLVSLITAETIRLGVAAHSWQEVVDKAGSLLLGIGAIEPRYIEAMKEIIVQNGPYMVTWPGIALLHAHPDEGVRRLCMSLVALQEPVKFGHPENDPVDLAIALGTVDQQSHVNALLQLIKILASQEAVGRIRSAVHEWEVIELVSHFSAGQPG
jgi:mannitol operon transcriptional antiterminator